MGRGLGARLIRRIRRREMPASRLGSVFHRQAQCLKLCMAGTVLLPIEEEVRNTEKNWGWKRL